MTGPRAATPLGSAERRFRSSGTGRSGSTPKAQRTTWARARSLEPVALAGALVSAIRPAESKGAAIVMPRCVTEATTEHLAEISRHVAQDAHAVALLDQAGWHPSRALVVPDTITLVPLPAHAPDLNPLETLRQFMRDTWLSNRILRPCDDILDHCCGAWNRLADEDGPSSPSVDASGPMGSDQWEAV